MKRLCLFHLGLLTVSLLTDALVEAADTRVEFFENRIRPVLVQHCYECHSTGADKIQGNLLLDHRQGWQKGGDSGPAIIPGNPAESLIIDALKHESFEMPPDQKLAETVIADFTEWILQGAIDPRDQPPSPSDAAEAAWKAKLAERSRWWSLQPLKDIMVPDVIDAQWSSDIDRFILSRLNREGLSPASPADPNTLLRRLSFVLTGLPPSPAEVLSFEKAYAGSPESAYESAVDRLLSSPHFGERFARHWMDVVRYTDTYGYEWDNPAKGSWEYRDYLIRAFNDDIGFDQLIREQLAGDLIAEPRINSEQKINESLIGPMFYHLGEHRHGSSLQFNGIHQEMVNNKIDAFSKAFLGMTVACARCHNHKLDAISQADYYALAGVFMSPRWSCRVLDLPGKHDSQIAQLKQIRSEISQRLKQLWRQDVERRNAAAFKTWGTAHGKAAQTALGDVSRPLTQLATAQSDADIPRIWNELVTEWKTEREKRIARNRGKYIVLTDFSEPGFPEGWVTEGTGTEHGYAAGGEPLVVLTGNAIVQELLTAGYHTHALSSKLPGALRLPAEHELPGHIIDLKLKGGEWSGYVVVPQNAFQTEEVKFFNANQPAAWTGFVDKPLNNGVSRVRVEVVTSALNPNFPPRTGLANASGKVLPNNDFGDDKRSWFSLTGIYQHDQPGAPVDEMDYFTDLFERPIPNTIAEAWEHIANWYGDSIQRWSEGKHSNVDIERINWILANGFLQNAPGEDPELQTLLNRYRDIESTIEFPRTCLSMDERVVSPLNYRLNVRGNVDEDGPAIPRDFLEVFHGQHDVGKSAHSGRLELANYLSNPDNPQTARVYVNRVWQWIFGTGIVSTPSDFGKLGGRPSHPELLDWMARHFMEEGWSTKRLVRELVVSQAFRQSSEVTESASNLDAENRLLHHYPTRRLEAEAIRDNLLAVSGRLNRQFYGKPFDPPRSVEDDKKRLFSGPLDSDGRRSIYMKMSIMDPPKFLMGFNLPDLKLPTGRRDVTNVPAQALIMLNDPLVTTLAEYWAGKLIEDGNVTPETRIEAMFLTAFARTPSPPELSRWSEALREFTLEADLMNDKTAWAELAHLMMNTKEFLYYR